MSVYAVESRQRKWFIGERLINMNLQIPSKVSRILDTLAVSGYEAYAVGGCIRDTVLGRTPDDWDITTSARPEEVKKLFRRTVDTGLQHGTVTVLLGDDSYEVTTYRIDGAYEDHRHPTEVLYASLLSEDLMRRDFTINAMAYNPDIGLVDLYGGIEDLQKKVIRCVGNPVERFTEDALRIMRAVRFSAQLGFSIENDTNAALHRLAPTLVHVSKERIQVELLKLLMSQNPHYVERLESAGILKVILPELCGKVDASLLLHLQRMPADRYLRLAALLLPLGEQTARRVLRDLKFDNATILAVGKLIRWYGKEIQPDMRDMRWALYEIGDELMPYLLTFQSCRRPVKELMQTFEQVQKQGQCYQLKQLAITGNDLLAMGMKPGRQIGELLHKCLELVLDEPEKNKACYLQEYVKNIMEF